MGPYVEAAFRRPAQQPRLQRVEGRRCAKRLNRACRSVTRAVSGGRPLRHFECDDRRQWYQRNKNCRRTRDRRLCVRGACGAIDENDAAVIVVERRAW